MLISTMQATTFELKIIGIQLETKKFRSSFHDLLRPNSSFWLNLSLKRGFMSPIAFMFIIHNIIYCAGACLLLIDSLGWAID